MSFEQDLYIMGALNKLAFIKTKQTDFLSAAKDYFERGLRLGPNRPQFLYSLFDIYRIIGDVEGAKAIAGKILSQWPDDKKVQTGLDEFLQKVASFEAKK